MSHLSEARFSYLQNGPIIPAPATAEHHGVSSPMHGGTNAFTAHMFAKHLLLTECCWRHGGHSCEQTEPKELTSQWGRQAINKISK